MNKKSMAKIGAISMLAVIVIIMFLVVAFTFFSSAITDKQEYVLGEKVKFNLENMGDYEIKIITPSTSYIRLGSNDIFIFEPAETGDYNVELWRGGGKENYYFSVVGNVTEEEWNETGFNETEDNETEYPEDLPFGYNAIKIGEDINWSKEMLIESAGRTKVRIPEAAENIKVYKVNAAGREEIDFEVRDSIIRDILDILQGENEKEIILEASGKIVIEYTTEGPKKQETQVGRTKEVKISSPEGIHYENVLAFTEIEASSLHFIYVYWKEEGKFVDFKSYDLNEDGLVDRIEWIVPHLSEQTFEVIIITKAEHLDYEREFIEDVYNSVYVRDDIWQEIPEGDYLRVTFEKNLTAGNDITLYARGIGTVSVYEKDKNELLMAFNISGEGWYKEYLNLLADSQDTFDLLSVGNIEYDYVVDPYYNTTLVDEGFESDSPYYYDDNGNWTRSGTASTSWDRRSGGQCGTYYAHIDGNYYGDDPGASTYITLDSGLADLSGASGGYVIFYWRCDIDFDNGEDFSYDEYYSGSWHNDVFSYNLEGCTDTYWTYYRRDLPSEALQSDFQVRFAVESSETNEDSGVDCFQIIRTNFVNTPPNNPSPKVNSTYGLNYSSSDLNCYSIVSDDDNHALNVTVVWYKNNVTNLTLSYNNSYANGTFFSSVLSGGNLSVGDNWSCGLRTYDGYNYSNWVNSSSLLVLAPL